jgi:hypothetical protein
MSTDTSIQYSDYLEREFGKYRENDKLPEDAQFLSLEIDRTRNFWEACPQSHEFY